MENQFIATTSTDGLRPLGTAPQRSYELIVSSVRDAEAALLFAEPVSSQFGDKVDWYTERPGRVRPLGDLDEAGQETLRARLAELVARVRSEAETLSAQDDTESFRLSEALSNALEIPNEDSIFAVIAPDGTAQPVLVNWAWLEDRQSAVRGVLRGADTRAAAAAAAAAATAAQADDTQGGADDAAATEEVAEKAGPSVLWWWLFWLGWLILALLIAAILVAMIRPCALRLPGVPSYCEAAAAETSDAVRRTEVLRDRIALLEREIGIMDRACQPAPDRPEFLPPRQTEVPRTLPPVTPPADRADIERLDRAGAQTGDLTFSLIWDGPDDLDLEVFCPTGERLFWGTRAACNGVVDIDTGVGAPSPEPVENIYFESPVTGDYGIRVTMPTSRSGGAPQPFKLLVRRGTQVDTFEGVVSGRDTEWNETYQFGGN